MNAIIAISDGFWHVLNMMRNLEPAQGSFPLDSLTCDKIVKLILKIKEAMNVKAVLQSNLHTIQ